MPTRRISDDGKAVPEFLILGLGNPGDRYRETRHNLGFRVADAFAAAGGARFREGPGPSLVGFLRPPRVGAVAKPLTWMNRSGVAARALCEAWGGGPAIGRILVVADDLDLPLGRIRFRAGGGDGGHRGLQSIREELGSRDFPRLRLGIGRPLLDDREDIVDHVLEAFAPEEDPTVTDVVERACRGIDVFVEDGISAAMNRFNASN